MPSEPLDLHDDVQPAWVDGLPTCSADGCSSYQGDWCGQGAKRGVVLVGDRTEVQHG